MQRPTLPKATPMLQNTQSSPHREGHTSNGEVSQPDRHTGRRRAVAGLDIGRVGTLQSIDGFIRIAGPPRGVRKKEQIARREGPFVVGRREGLAGFLPRVSFNRFSAGKKGVVHSDPFPAVSCGHDDTGDLGPKAHGFLLLLSAPADCNKETDVPSTPVPLVPHSNCSRRTSRLALTRATHNPNPRPGISKSSGTRVKTAANR